MSKFIVKGGKKLKGAIKVNGSKNAALPIMCASLLTKEKSTLLNVPDIADIRSMIKILEGFNAKMKFEKNTLEIDPKNLRLTRPPNELICKMRASILLLGPLLANFGKAQMVFPGGCVLGRRSVHSHTDALKNLGCKVIDETNELSLEAKNLKGQKIIMSELSVTATENVIMAAVKAEGKTVIKLAAAEPHVQDLCKFLNKMGARIEGIGTNTLTIEGAQSLHGTTYEITGDYLEAGTFAIAAAATNGDVVIKGIDTNQLDSLWQKFSEVGVEFELKENEVHVKGYKNLKAVEVLRTAVFPSFPTDLQAPFAVLLTQAKGESKVFETLFEGRLNYIAELERMGAKVQLLNPHQALIKGPSRLKGIPIASYDIRAGAAMVIAALLADSETEISNINYLDRGYESFDKRLRTLGAEIRRV